MPFLEEFGVLVPDSYRDWWRKNKKSMKKATILILMLFTVKVYGQKRSNDSGEKKSSAGAGNEKINLVGNWQGILTQPNGGLDDNYAFWFTFKQTKDSIHGFSRLELSNSNNFGIIELKGTIKGNVITVQETKITEENIRYGASWCIKRYVLTYDPNDGSLSGTWESTKTCGPGKIYLFKAMTDKFNKSDPQSFVYIAYDEFKVSIKNLVSCKGKKVVMNDVKFDDAKGELTDASKKHLDDFAEILKTNPKLSLKILAHTDNSGDDFPNLRLTMNHAKAVYDYLVSKGIKASRLQYEGFGEARPLRDNTTENGRMKNRRMEFEVVSE
jgi:outer membrane protein OmpA-like peptidoglycan-associated protein